MLSGISLQKIHSFKVNLKNKIYKWNLISEKLIWNSTAFYLGEGPCRININPKPSTSTTQALCKYHSKLSWCIALISNGSSVYQNWVKPYNDTTSPLGVGSISKEEKNKEKKMKGLLFFMSSCTSGRRQQLLDTGLCGLEHGVVGVTAVVNCWVPLAALQPHSWS